MVPEIYYNNGSGYPDDVDHKVYYLSKNNKTVASLAEIIADPSLVARVADANGNDPSGYPAALWAEQYAATTAVWLLTTHY